MSGANKVSRWEIVGDLLVSVASAGVIPDADWAIFVNDLRTKPITKYFAGTIGKAETTSTQRKQAAEILKSRGIRTAAITDDAFTRGIVTAVSWLGANVAAFAWSDTDNALRYLEVEEPMATRARETIGRLRAAEIMKRG